MIYDVVDGLDGRFSLVARRLSDPYVKDYDALEAPAGWQRRFDVSRWAFFSALADGQRIGSAIVAWKTPGLEMLEGRSDLAVLWDVRVVPSKRRQGIGAALFETAAAACRFYMRQGVKRTECDFARLATHSMTIEGDPMEKKPHSME